MAIDTPATIAILGAGPIGLETALYARFLGYDVVVYERGEIAENVMRWGHVRLFSPFGMNRSTLALGALAAQDPSWQPPGDDERLTGMEWAQRYLLPLSQTDLLADCIQTQTTVVQVGRVAASKTELIGDASRGEMSFLLLLRRSDGTEAHAQADIVIDTSGVYGNHRWMGQGGVPALGEQTVEPQIDYCLRDVLGRDRQQYAGRKVLVVGAGYSAATTIVQLSELAAESSETQITWATRQEDPQLRGPMARIPNDKLPHRDAVARAANLLAVDAESPVTYLPATVVVRVEKSANSETENTEGFDVELSGQHAGQARFDRIVANVGYRPDASIYEELQVHQCYASEAPMKLAAALLSNTSGDCLEQTPVGAAALMTSEPNYYILGNKSYGRDSRFLISIGLDQIRELFSVIGGRADLDLYQGTQNLVP